MFTVRPIESFDLPELQPYRTMRRQHEQRKEGIFVAEGEKVVRRLLESRLTVLSALLPDHWLRNLEHLLTGRPEMIQVFVAEKKLLETLTGFSMYQGLLALAKVPPAARLDDLAGSAERPAALVGVEGLSSAENLGTVARSCAAFGIDGLIVGETCASAFLRRAVRSSMGAVFELPILETVSLVRTLQELRGRGIRCIAAHPGADGRTLWQANFRQPCCVVFGSEGYGLSPAALAGCDDAVAIPMAAGVDSLNVAGAAAAFLCEVSRQRRETRSSEKGTAAGSPIIPADNLSFVQPH